MKLKKSGLGLFKCCREILPLMLGKKSLRVEHDLLVLRGSGTGNCFLNYKALIDILKNIYIKYV